MGVQLLLLNGIHHLMIEKARLTSLQNQSGNEQSVRKGVSLNNYESKPISNTAVVSNSSPGKKDELTISTITETGVLPLTKSYVSTKTAPEAKGSIRTEDKTTVFAELRVKPLHVTTCFLF